MAFRIGLALATQDPTKGSYFKAFAAKVFKDCPPVLRLWAALGDVNPADRRHLMVTELPNAISGCNCQVEIPAVERMFWEEWGPTLAPPLIGISVAFAKDGTRVKNDAKAPWSEASKAIVAAATQGKPIAVQ